MQGPQQHEDATAQIEKNPGNAHELASNDEAE